ncbi:MAG: release factor glutamine methyltransferase [Pseudomonadota bacterium]|nr:release factor glutamine methyltransferase [Pseudomonadota bacterium]
MKSIKNLIHNSPVDKIDTKLILRHILNLSQVQLITQCERELTNAELTVFDEYCQLLKQHMPLNYIVGYREFYSRRFCVTTDTLIPRPETELLVDEVLALSASNAISPLRVLELGTGSGVIAISIKLERPALIVEATDKYLSALEVAKNNAAMLNADVYFYLSDWYTDVSTNNRYDIIVSNPPYIAKDDTHLAKLYFEPQHALTDFADGTVCLNHIIQNAPSYLNVNGWLLVEHGFEQGSIVRQLYLNSGFKNVHTIYDYANLERITVGQKND